MHFCSGIVVQEPSSFDPFPESAFLLNEAIKAFAMGLKMKSVNNRFCYKHMLATYDISYLISGHKRFAN